MRPGCRGSTGSAQPQDCSTLFRRLLDWQQTDRDMGDGHYRQASKVYLTRPMPERAKAVKPTDA